MAASLTELQAQLTALRAARASGIRSVQHGDARTEYKSDAEMERAEAALVGLINGVNSVPRVSVASYTSD